MQAKCQLMSVADKHEAIHCKFSFKLFHFYKTLAHEHKPRCYCCSIRWQSDKYTNELHDHSNWYSNIDYCSVQSNKITITNNHHLSVGQMPFKTISIIIYLNFQPQYSIRQLSNCNNKNYYCIYYCQITEMSDEYCNNAISNRFVF